jgi:uncharacterized protein YndB with AHSA1/START domain/uncharacterized damage-inducible protein DinB
MTERFPTVGAAVVTVSRLVDAPPAHVYDAFTNSSCLREWLADAAQIASRPGGRLYVAWNSGDYAGGEYTHLESPGRVAFTWRGRGEPAETHVEVTLAPQGSGTLVTIEHAGFGTGTEWDQATSESRSRWQHGLDNLASVLETGEDLRIVRRPMMGIGLSDFNEEIARQTGVPVSTGIRLDNTAPGLAADAAGLSKGDVLVELADRPITDFASLADALQGHLAGDRVGIAYYRGAERRTAVMELSRRPIPAITWDPVELSQAVAGRYAEATEALRGFFAEVSEAEASHRPAAAEWSAREVLAHLIHAERGFQNNVGEIVTAAEAVYDDLGGNLLARVEATVAVYPTTADLLAAYERSTAETVALLAHLPDEAVRHKGHYWRLAYAAVDSPFHFTGHMEQMRAAIESARHAPDA